MDAKTSFLRQVFESALDVPENDLPAFLAKACGGDASVEQQVLSLLRAHRDPIRFLDPAITPEESGGAGVISNLARIRWMMVDDRPGDVIDRYKLVEVIGEGGHGIVFRAEQEQPVRRQVALKVIRRGMDGDSARARFETERQTLAQLEHPGIAKLFDAGTTEAGRPYFVMELVSGVAVTQFCDQRRLPIRRRVELFTAICRAVHHAHQRGVIHGDLKPSNVLMTESDGVVSPKVIDFGISRSNSTSGSEEESGQVFGTPQYMSPEQVVSNSAVEIRSDVYALGAMLYELLTGVMPIDATDKLRDLAELREVFTSASPVPPSRRIAEMVPGSTDTIQISQNRAGSMKALSALLHEDLDWIVMKAIHHHRADRYDSVAALADDLQRYLERRPVLAAPPNVSYASRRFVSRNKTAVVLSVVILISVLITLCAVIVSLIRVRQALDRVVSAEKLAVKSESNATSKLRDSYIDQAKADARSGSPGQRFKSLQLISLAAQIAPSLELRNQAIACMSLPDLEEIQKWDAPGNGTFIVHNQKMDLYAASDLQGNVRVCRGSDRGKICQLPGDGHPCDGSIRFSPDGKYLAVRYRSTERGLRVWDLHTQKPVFELGPSVAIEFSYDSKWFAVANPAVRQASARSLEIHALPPGDNVRTIPAGGDVVQMAIRPGDQQIAVSDGAGDVRLVSLKSTGITKVPSGLSQTMSLAWSPDGRRLAIGGSASRYRIDVVDVATGHLQTEMLGQLAMVVGLAFTPDGQFLFSQGWDSRTRVWDTASGAELLNFDGFGGSMQLAADDIRISFEGVQGHQMAKLIAGDEFQSVNGPTDDILVTSTDFSPDGTLIAATGVLGVRIWNLKTGQQVSFIACPGPRTVLFDRDGTHLIVSTATDVMRWKTADVLGRDDPLPERVTEGHTCAMAATPGCSKLVFGTSDGTVRVADPSRMEESLPIGTHSRPPRYAAISPDGCWAATSTRFDRSFKIWNLTTRSLATEIPLLENQVETGQVAFSPDGKILVVAESLAYRWFSIGDWKPLLRLDRSRATTAGIIAFSPDGKLLALGGPGYSILLVDPSTGREFATLDTQIPHFSGSITFSRDSNRLAVGGSGPTVNIWDIRQIRRELALMNLDWH